MLIHLVCGEVGLNYQGWARLGSWWSSAFVRLKFLAKQVVELFDSVFDSLINLFRNKTRIDVFSDLYEFVLDYIYSLSLESK